MNDFEQRWQQLARLAGRLLDDNLPELRPGFAARVLARSRETQPDSWEELLGALSLRAVLVTSFVCLACGGFAFSEWYEFRIEPPAMERTVTSELPLPWP